MGEEYVFHYDNQGELRLDKFLVQKFPQFSRTKLQSFIQDGFVSVNRKTVFKGGFILDYGNEISISIPDIDQNILTPEEIPLDIIFENDDLIVVNKPAGMVVHPAAGHLSGTLVHAALHHSPKMEGIGGQHRPGIVHRLDKDTSGVILIAKNDKTHWLLQEQFKKRKIHKTYYAITDGIPPTPIGKIDAPIGRDSFQRKKMAIVTAQKGKQAVTDYKVIEKFVKNSLIAAFPLTGRTHQIRLHLAFLGCPIVGDTVYGHKRQPLGVKRQMLHAFRLEVCLPGETTSRSFEAPLPDDMKQLISMLEK